MPPPLPRPPRSRAPLLLALLVAGCASASPQFRGVTPVEMTIDARRYAVFLRDDGPTAEVQVIRLGHARRPEHRAILLAMRSAAEQATGCRLIDGSIEGDSGVMTARMRCPV